jgi:hypothetical protein
MYAVKTATTAVDDATESDNQAAGDSGHEKIDEALTAFKEANDKLAEIAGLIAKGQAAANEYADSLG